MVTQWIPISKVYDKVVSDITFPVSYKNHVLSFIGECTETMQISKVLVLESEKKEVIDYKTTIPCNAINIIAVYKDGYRLHCTKNINGKASNRDRTLNSSSLNVWETVIPLATVITTENTLPLSYYTQVIQNLKSYTLNNENCFGVDYYKQNGTCLQFSFEKSNNVEIFYEGVLRNQEGEILVPDNIWYLEAIVNWVEHKLIRKGVIKINNVNRDCLAEYKENRNKAINNITFPTPDQMQSMTDKLGLFTYDLYNNSEL